LFVWFFVLFCFVDVSEVPWATLHKQFVYLTAPFVKYRSTPRKPMEGVVEVEMGGSTTGSTAGLTI
jgi:hypothetical protein